MMKVDIETKNIVLHAYSQHMANSCTSSATTRYREAHQALADLIDAAVQYQLCRTKETNDALLVAARGLDLTATR